jgi:riboflavin synthase alpha subunit
VSSHSAARSTSSPRCRQAPRSAATSSRDTWTASGSITVDGVALTVTNLTGGSFEVALVQHTLDVTTLGALEPGDPVNLEVDVLAKYVEKLIGPDTI